MIRKLKPGEWYYSYENENDDELNKNPYEESDIWVDENNFQHNEPGVPSFFKFFKVSKYSRKVYRVHGRRHNLFGPAFIDYNEKGEIVNEEYYINSVFFYKSQWEEKAYIERNRILMLNEI